MKCHARFNASKAIIYIIRQKSNISFKIPIKIKLRSIKKRKNTKIKLEEGNKDDIQKII